MHELAHGIAGLRALPAVERGMVFSKRKASADFSPESRAWLDEAERSPTLHDMSTAIARASFITEDEYLETELRSE